MLTNPSIHALKEYRKIKNIDKLQFDLLGYCNLSCSGCPTTKVKEKLDFDKVIPFLEIVAINNNIERIYLCGNGSEPLLHPDITRIICTLHELFPETNIILATNGENFKYFYPNELLKYPGLKGPDSKLLIEWPVDGTTNEMHSITRTGGTLDKVIKNYKEYHKPFRNIVVCSRHQGNENHVEEIYKFIVDNFGVEPFFRDTSRESGALRRPTKFSKNSPGDYFYSKELLMLPFKTLQLKESIKPKYQILFHYDGSIYPCCAYYYNAFSLYPKPLKPYLPECIPQVAYDNLQMYFDGWCSKYTCSKYTDKRRCVGECGKIEETFRFDDINDLREL